MGEAAANLPVEQCRIQDRAGVVHGDIAIDAHFTRHPIDFLAPTRFV